MSDAIPPAESRPEPGSRSPELLRALGLGTATAIVVGNVIGSGIFAKPAEIAASAGSFSTILAGWVLGGVLCLLGALCFAELSAMLPRAGGLYVFLREGYGRPAGFLFGCNEFVFGRPASIGALAVLFVTLLAGVVNNIPFLAEMLGGETGGFQLTEFGRAAGASVVIAGLTWINIVGVVWSGHVQNLTTVFKAGFLLLVGLLPFLITLAGGTGVVWSNYATTVAPDKSSLAAQFAAVLLAVMWAYNGWHDVAPVAEEIREPHRNVPLALVIGVSALIVLYVGANLAYHGVLSMAEIKGAGRETAQVMMRKLFTPYGEFAVVLGVGTMSAVLMCSVFGTINSNLMLGPRIAFAMGRDLPALRALAHVHADYRTPAVAILLQGGMSVALVFASAALIEWNPAFREKSVFDMMTDYVTFSANIFYTLCVLAVFILRIGRPDLPRPYLTWGYPVVPALYVAGSVWFLVMVYVAKPFESRMGLILIAAGLPVYVLCRLLSRRSA